MGPGRAEEAAMDRATSAIDVGKGRTVMPDTLYCKKHSDTETNLRCSRCDEPVCPRCLVHAPVGVRCPDCAQVKRLPTFDVTGVFLARAIAVGLPLGIAGGAAALFTGLFVAPLLSSIVILGVGYLAGEGISLAVNRKRGRALKFVAAGSVLIAVFTVSIIGLDLFQLLASAAAIYIAVNRL